jgi:outer membrane protein
VNQRTSLIFNVILGVAVAVLYFLHFNVSKTPVSASDKTDVDSTVVEEIVVDSLPNLGSSAGAVAYINWDEFIDKYQYYKDGVSSLENDYKRKGGELMKKQQVLEDNVARYQKLAGSLTPEIRQQREGELMEEEKRLIELKDRLEKDLSDKQDNFSKEFLMKIDNYLKSLGKEKNYSYVFTYTKGGPSSIVYAKDSLDITKQVVKSLNDLYKKKK